jgi:3-oxoacyl-[acyl-carrier protein] reductase
MASEGAGVLVADINGSAAEPVAREIGKVAVPFAVDVTDGPRHRAMIEAAIAQFGDLDCVINNAGFTRRNQPLLDVDEATFDRVHAVNVKSIFHSMHTVVPHFRRRGGGVIINIGSTAGIRPRPGLTWYNGSKAAVNLLTNRSRSLGFARL